MAMVDMAPSRGKERLIKLVLEKDRDLTTFREELLRDLYQLPSQNAVHLQVDPSLIPKALDAVYTILDRLARGLNLFKELSELGGVSTNDYPSLLKVSCKRIVEVMALLPMAVPMDVEVPEPDPPALSKVRGTMRSSLAAATSSC